MKNNIFKKLMIASLIFAGYAFVSAQGDAELMLKPSSGQVIKGEEFTVDIILKNPGQEGIISVRSWLSYDSGALEAIKVDSSNSPFTLSAPGEDNVIQNEGRVKIGRSNISGGVSEPEVTVATVYFRALADYETSSAISFYDYQISELGHTSVNIIDQGFPVNILSKAPVSIQMSLNPGVTPPVVTPPVVTPPVVTPPVFTPPQNIGGGLALSLERPVNLQINTGPGYVDLLWDAIPDANRSGFNIYYGKVSGQYTRRRSLGNFNNYRLDGLNNNETYYLAVTAYDQFNRESDYSNEVGVIINQPLSSTSPFASILDQMMSKIPSSPQNGPLVGWLIFSAAGFGGAIVFGRKKQRRIKISNL